MKQDNEYIGKSYYSKTMEAYLHVTGVCSDNYEHTEKEKKVRVLYVGKGRNVIQEYDVIITFLSKVTYCKEISNKTFLKAYDKALRYFNDNKRRFKVQPLKLDGDKTMKYEEIQWAARCKFGLVGLFQYRPIKSDLTWRKGGFSTISPIDLPSVQWEDEKPTKVKVTIEILEDKDYGE